MAAKKSGNIMEKDTQITQAVILADIFDHKFVPISLEKPAALLPLLNTPVIDYTIEFLAAGGIKEIIVFATSHTKELKEHVRAAQRWAGVSVTFETTQEGRSAGHALRAIHERQLIKKDFVLVTGDVVSNLRLDRLIEIHRARGEKDKDALMTMVFKNTGPFHVARSFCNNTIISIDQGSGKLLYYDNGTTDSVEFEISILEQNPNVSFLGNLVDCYIDICSPKVLSLMEDNFDYEDLRHDLVKGVLAEGIYGNIYTHFISNEYACRAQDFGTYHAVSQDVINRWAYPIVPENNFLGVSYTFLRGDIYIEKSSQSVKLDRSCKVSSKSVIGRGTTIGAGSSISNSVIGRNCVIGSKVVVEGAYIWDNVVIENGSQISKSIICDGATILKNTTISKGCIISFKVTVGPDFVLKEGSRLTKFSGTIQDENDDPITPTEEISLGSQKGLRWKVEKDLEDNSLVQVQEPQKLSEENLVSDSDDDEPEETQKDVMKVLKQEVKEIIINNNQKDLLPSTLDSLIVEIKTRKFATLSTNVEFHDLSTAVLLALLQIVQQKKLSKKEETKEITTSIEKWSKLLAAFVKDPEDQVEFIYSFQEYCSEEGKYFFEIFQFVLHCLYDNEVIDEPAIEKWAKENQNLEPPENRFYIQCEPFLKWLNEAEEEEEEDDD